MYLSQSVTGKFAGGSTINFSVDMVVRSIRTESSHLRKHDCTQNPLSALLSHTEDECVDAKAESRNMGSELRNMHVELALPKNKITLNRDTAVMFETFADVETLHDTGTKSVADRGLHDQRSFSQEGRRFPPRQYTKDAQPAIIYQFNLFFHANSVHLALQYHAVTAFHQ